MTACSDDAWHTLWVQFNKHTTAVIRVSRAALAEVVECNGGLPSDMVARQPRDGSATVEVHRHALYAFLCDHPKVCTAP